MPFSSSRMAIGGPLAGALIFPLADYAVNGLLSDVNADSYAVVARPLAFAVAFSVVLAVLGVIVGAPLARVVSISTRAGMLGCGLAGPATAALFLYAAAPFVSRFQEALLWAAVAAGLACLLTASAVGLESREPALSWTERVLAIAPTVLAGVALYLALRYGAPGWQWAALAAAAALATWLSMRPGSAVVFNGLLAAAAIASPWLGPAEPRLDVASGLIGAPEDLTPPRVILISIDTLRADELGFLRGQGVPTPAFDQLASDGVVFEKAYSTSGWTLTALSSIHLGVSPWVHGAWTGSDKPSDTPRSLAERFSEAGYRTAKIGYNAFLTEAMTGPALSKGFQTIADYPAFVRPRTIAFEFLVARNVVSPGWVAGTDDLFGWAAAWVEDNADAPFFLWLHIFDPHQPYLPPAEFAPGGVTPAWNDPAAAPGGPFKSPEVVDQMRGLYRGEIAYVDDRLGRFLDRVRDLGLYDDALVALVSDHGDEFFEHSGFGHGHTLYDELLRVPLAIKLPRSEKKNRVAGPVSTLSLAPTLLGLANVPYDPEDFSAGPLSLEGDGQPTSLFAGGSYNNEPREAVVFGNLKLIRHLGFGAEQLYDLETDPGERYNLAGARPEDVRRGVELLQQTREKALALRERLGVTEAAPTEYGPAEKRMLRSLGYIQ